ncbi:MAG TPA: type VI secretion system accessory protein TagJ [Longimicrobiaceae bacterium]|nr:type VI secretion system accessory protein TagJ [Longimicrobiaceae bacterium]
MKAQALFEAGKLDEAIAALGADLRDDPTDVRRRTFLFELLCFAGEFDRAEKHLEVIAGSSRDAEMGAWLYRSALHAERTRREMFQDGAFPKTEANDGLSGTLNGVAFESLSDADPRIGARLEVFAAGQYTWIPLEHIASIQMQPPQRLRDLLWAPARIQPGPEFTELDLGEVLLPVLTPLAYRNPDSDVKLGRVTDWEELEDGTPVPVGQKLFIVDGEPVPILELRELELSTALTPHD